MEISEIFIIYKLVICRSLLLVLYCIQSCKFKWLLRGFTVFKIKKLIKKVLFTTCIMYDMPKYHMLKTYINIKNIIL